MFAIKKKSEREKTRRLLKIGNFLKFKLVIQKFVHSIERTILKNYKNVSNFVFLFLTHSASSDTRLQKIRRLKGKITIEAKKIKGKLSKSESTKDYLGRTNYKINFLKNRSKETLHNFAFCFPDKDKYYTKATIDEENRMLELKIRQNENYLYKFMRDVTKDILVSENSERIRI